MKHFIVVLGMLCTLAIPALAQKAASTGSISLKITDNNGKPLPFANVLLRKAADSSLVKGELTSEAGDCLFERIPDGRYFVQASQIGFTTWYAAPFTIDAAHRQITLPAVTMATNSKTLKAVDVTAIKPFIEKGAGKTVLNVENSIAAAGNTALDILKRAPGVQLDNSENIKLKGTTVTVMIDGKLTYLSGEELTNMLKNTPAESISQIEIITSPSAKYDASGNGGIINIKTKKGKLTGVNGTVSGTLSQAKYGYYNVNGNINWRTTKFNLFGDLGRADRKVLVTREYRRTITDKDVTTFLAQDLWQRNNFKRNAYKVGFDYFLNDKHTIGVLANGYGNSFNNQIFSETRLGKPGMSPDSLVNSISTNDNKFDNFTINLNYKAVLDTSGREFSVDADYARFNSNRHLQLHDSLYDIRSGKYRNPNGIRNTGGTRITIKSLKADLAWPLGNQGKLEAGFKVSSVTTGNSLIYDSLKNGQFVFAPAQSNQFNYTEDIYAAYASYRKQLHNTGIQVGLRLENTHSNGESVTLKSNVKRSYLDFFPNLNIEQKLNDKNKIALAYSRRIERPEYGQLNPFAFYLDKYTFFQGDPYLKPQYTDNVELSYTFLDKFIATLGVNKTKDFINEFLSQNDSTKVSMSTLKNYQRSEVYSLVLTLPFQVTKWWSSDNNINCMQNEYRFTDNTGKFNKTSSFTYSFNSTNTITLPHDIKLEIMGYYNSPFVYAIFRGYNEYNLNLGIQKTFWNKAATIKFSYNNLLRNEAYRGVAANNNLDMHIFNTWQFKTANIYFSYRFGNSSIKGARERKTGTSDEQKRAG
ncbi:outer membrane beta-barrel family protein [Chitinophaga solisilvae]|uniref:outer membrane beta-barrel family protein n=1 Tax=Chitinophaga solisilvae TaxID=1233460 RepID=UPI00136CD38B|nr:outer membrane beta-barrel family protein [Chitinophaga solisilvae]